MRLVTVQKYQSIWDVAIQYYGSPDAVAQLISDNPGVINFETRFDYGTKIWIDDTMILDQPTVDSVNKSKSILATAQIQTGPVIPPPPVVVPVTATEILEDIVHADYMSGFGPSSASSVFKIVAEGLGAGNILLTPSANLEIWNGSAWVSSVVPISTTDGAVTTDLIYKIRIKAGLAVGAYSESLTISGPGAANYVVHMSGNVTTISAFIMTVKTDNPGSSTNTQFELPLNNGFTYNAIIDWGDGQTTHQVTSINPVHTYLTAGTYTIKITGQFDSIFFNTGGDALKLISIDNWGAVKWKTFSHAFQGCANMVGTFTDVPDLSQCTVMDFAFMGCTLFNSYINNWNVGTITSMSALFYGCNNFNQPLDAWDVRNVTVMTGMFTFCYVFNQPLNSWRTSACNYFNEMFYNCFAFNQDLPNWDLSNATNISYMFYGCSSFNGDVSNWNVSHVLNMNSIFYGCSSFNRPLNAWNVSNVTNMAFAFLGCSAFNQPLFNWNVANVTTMSGLFFNCSAFNQNLNTWITTSLTNCDSVFYGCSVFNSPLGNWNMANVTSISSMFVNCYAFNQPLNTWNTSSLLTLNQTFYQATSFNQPLNGWDVSSCQNFNYTFYGCTAFQQDISMWDVSGAFIMYQFMAGLDASYPAAYLDAIYNTWSTLTLFPNVQVDFGAIKYTSAGAAGKAVLTGSPNNWSIIDGGI